MFGGGFGTEIVTQIRASNLRIVYRSYGWTPPLGPRRLMKEGGSSMSRIVLAVALVGLMLMFNPGTTSAASLTEVVLGIGFDTSVSPWRIVQPTSSVTNLDWPVYALVLIQNVVNEATGTVERTGPDGKTLWSTEIRLGGNV